MDLDFSTWEFDEFNQMITVTLLLNTLRENSQFLEKLKPQLSGYKTEFLDYIYLPVTMQDWFNQQKLTGEWFYDVKTRSGDFKTKYNFRFYFQYADDAVLFKLTWT